GQRKSAAHMPTVVTAKAAASVQYGILNKENGAARDSNQSRLSCGLSNGVHFMVMCSDAQQAKLLPEKLTAYLASERPNRLLSFWPCIGIPGNGAFVLRLDAGIKRC